MDKFNYLKEQLTAALATWQQTNGGKTTVGWMHAANPEVIAALLAELEAKTLECSGIQQERELFRVERIAHQQYAQELEQRVAELSELETHNQCLIKKNADLTQQNTKLGERLATPVRLPTTSGRLGVAYTRVIPEVIEAIRAAGFKVMGDEQC